MLYPPPDSSAYQLPEDGKRYKTLFETMNQGVVYQNANGVITSANPAAERILGLTIDQLQGLTSIDPRWKSIREDGTDYPGHDHPITNALKTGNADKGRIMGIYNPLTDNTRWIIVDGIPDFHAGATTPYQAHAIFTDITERIRAEKTIKESERKTTTLINNLKGLVYRCRIDHEWSMEYLSDGITKLTGYAKNDFIENKVRSFNSIIHKDDQQYLWDTIQTAVKKNEHFQLEYRVMHADGSIKWVLENGCGIFEGDQLVALEGYITDVSDKKAAERALKESEEKFRAAFVASPDLVSITKLVDGSYVDVNKAFVTKSGFKREEIIGTTAYNLNIWQNPDDRFKLTNILRKNGYVINFEANFRAKDKSIFTGLMSATVLHISGEAHLLAYTRDITELKKIENELIVAKETAEENEALLRAIIDNAPFDIWARDKAQTGILENKLTNKHFGISILGRKPDLNGVPKEIVELWLSNNLRVLNGEIINEECEYVEKGVAHTYKQIIAPILTSTGIDGVVGFNIDITENKKAQLAIDNERKTLRTLLETIPDYVFMKDLEGRYLTCNSKFAGFAGISVKEIKGKTDYELFSKEQADSFRYHDKVALDSNKPMMNLESVAYKSDGHVEILETYKAPAFDANGQLIGIIGFSHDITAVHATRVALKEREEIYSSIVNQANDSIALIDFETGRFFEFNHSAYQSLGYTQHEFSLMSLRDIEAAHNDADIKDHFTRIKEANGLTFETCHRHKSGEILDRRVSAKIINIRDRDYVSAIWIDITAQKKTQASLIEKDLIFQSLMDNSPIYIFFKDHNIKSLYLSKNFEQMLGKPLHELIGKDMNELFPSQLALSIIKDDQKILNQRELVVVDEDFNGHYYTTIKFPIIRENKPPLLAGFSIDITDRQLAQNALRQSERTLKQAQQIANMGSYEYDIENDTSLWSENLYKIYDIDPVKTLNSVLHKIVPSVVHPEDLDLLKSNFKDALQRLGPYDLGYRIKRKDGSIRYIHSWADFEINETGKPIRIIGLVQDVTDQKIAEEEVRTLNENLEKRVDERTLELQAANHELEAFAYTVSHDLRAPLRAINGFTNILKEDFSSSLNADGLNLIGIITDNAQRMGVLIDDLLTFSRLSRSDMNLMEVDMNHLVKMAFQELTSPEQRAGISFNIENLPAVFADNSLIKQVWMNLISNAIKFSAKTEKPVITISAKKEADKVIFKITDNGVGFNMKYAGKLFGVFQRLHSAREFEGTGAGLAIVQRIVVRHGGNVWATSTLGKGADFYFSLPAKISVI